MRYVILAVLVQLVVLFLGAVLLYLAMNSLFPTTTPTVFYIVCFVWGWIVPGIVPRDNLVRWLRREDKE